MMITSVMACQLGFENRDVVFCVGGTDHSAYTLVRRGQNLLRPLKLRAMRSLPV